MSIRIGVYDFFAYTIPGIIHLVFLALAYDLIDGETTAFAELAKDVRDVFDSALIGLAVLGSGAYLMGLVFDSIARYWGRLFGRRDPAEWAFDRFKKYNENIEINFTHGNWQVLLASVRAENYDIATLADKYQATHILLRNSSLGMLFIGVIFLIKAIVAGDWLTNIIVSAFLIAISIVCVKKAIVFSMWAYAFIFESFVAQTKDLKHLVGEA